MDKKQRTNTQTEPDQSGNIKDVARMFGTSKSSIRFWERKGLIEGERNEENDYRIYSKRSIVEIQDMLTYRNLKMPLKQIHQLQRQDVALEKQLLREHRDVIEEQIRTLRQSRRLLDRKLRNIARYEQLKERPYSFCEGMEFRAVDWDFNNTSLYVGDPEQHRLLEVFPPDGADVRSFISVPADYEGEDIVWEQQCLPEQKYMEFLLRTMYAEPEKNDLEEHLVKIREMGYEPGTVIAEYLVSGCEKEGSRFDYLRAVVEIAKK